MFTTVKDTSNRAKDTMTNEGGMSDAATAYRAKKEQVSEVISEGKKDLQEAKGKLQDAGHNIQDIAHRAGEQVRDISDTARDYASQASHNVQDLTDTLSTKVRRQPLLWTGAAALTGLLLGRLLTSRRS